jgi:hypothetical protein
MVEKNYGEGTKTVALQLYIANPVVELPASIIPIILVPTVPGEQFAPGANSMFAIFPLGSSMKVIGKRTT